MKFDLTKPCAECPFRNDIDPYLQPQRYKSLAAELERKTFACHKTVYTPQKRDKSGRFMRKEESHCAGALIVQEKSRLRGDMQQIAQRLGLYDPKKLQMNSPVYKNLKAFAKAAGE